MVVFEKWQLRSMCLAVIVFSAVNRYAAEPDPIAKWVVELGSDTFETRNAAEKILTKYVGQIPSEFMQRGARLFALSNKADAEIQSRISGILEAISSHVSIDGPEDANLNSDHGDDKNTVNDMPVLVIVVSSKEMFAFYRATVQTGHHGWKMPNLDWKELLLINVSVTSGNPGIYSGIESRVCLKSPTCRRDFAKKESVFHADLGSQRGPEFNWPRSSAIVMQYRLQVQDLPLIFSFDDQITHAQLRLEYKPCDAEWKDVKQILESRNLYALRKLAEKCDATVPAEVRRDFLQNSYSIDPLLPYVMFTEMARKCPDQFEKDYDYWVEKLPESNVAGKLFRGALFKGKEIIWAKK